MINKESSYCYNHNWGVFFIWSKSDCAKCFFVCICLIYAALKLLLTLSITDKKSVADPWRLYLTGQNSDNFLFKEKRTSAKKFYLTGYNSIIFCQIKKIS